MQRSASARSRDVFWFLASGSLSVKNMVSSYHSRNDDDSLFSIFFNLWRSCIFISCGPAVLSVPCGGLKQPQESRTRYKRAQRGVGGACRFIYGVDVPAGTFRFMFILFFFQSPTVFYCPWDLSSVQ